MTAAAIPTVLTRSAGRVIPTCQHEDPEMYPEFLPADAALAFACPAVATVYLFHPADPGRCYDDSAVGAFCDAHAAIQGPLESVAIADLPLVCSGCAAPVWLAHPDEHVLGCCDFCRTYRPADVADHASCSCPALAAYLAAMGDAS